MIYWFRVLVSALIVGGVGFGGALQAAFESGQPPTRYQLWSAGITATLLALNDIKSRLTPTNGG